MLPVSDLSNVREGEKTGGGRGVRCLLWAGRDDAVEEEESLVMELLCWMLLLPGGMRSRVALMLARQISQWQLASFRQPG